MANCWDSAYKSIEDQRWDDPDYIDDLCSKVLARNKEKISTGYEGEVIMINEDKLKQVNEFFGKNYPSHTNALNPYTNFDLLMTKSESGMSDAEWDQWLKTEAF